MTSPSQPDQQATSTPSEFMPKKTRKPGRPRGAKTAQWIVVIIDAPKCPVCGYSERKPLGNHGNKREQNLKQTVKSSDGKQYNRVVQQKTICLVCGAKLLFTTRHHNLRQNDR